jgi:hypothetical protein
VGPEKDGEKIVQVAGAPAPTSTGPDDDDVGHLMNWLDCMRDREQPNATVDHGFSHSLVCIMAAQSYWSGRKLYWDAQAERILAIETSPPMNTKLAEGMLTALG